MAGLTFRAWLRATFVPLLVCITLLGGSVLMVVPEAQTQFLNSLGWVGIGKVLLSKTTPVIVSSVSDGGWGTSPSIVASNGAATFTLNVGTGGTATTGSVTLPTASTGWNCFVIDRTTNVVTRETSTTTTVVTVTAASAWTASSVLQYWCAAY